MSRGQIEVYEIEVQVSGLEISKATPGSKTACPIAQALNGIDGFSHARVDKYTISFSVEPDGMRYTYHTPKRARDFQIDVDNGRKVSPFVLMLSAGDFMRLEPRRVEQRVRHENNFRRKATARAVAAERKIPITEAERLIDDGKEKVRSFDSNGVPYLPPAKSYPGASRGVAPRARAKTRHELTRSKRETTAEVFAQI